MKQKNEFQKNAASFEKIIIELENQNEKLVNENRESSIIISDLENKMNETLEQLALVQTQLEINQNQSEIQVERLKQLLRETEDELRIVQASPSRTPEKSISYTMVGSSPIKLSNFSNIGESIIEEKSRAITLDNDIKFRKFDIKTSKPSSFLSFENAMKKSDYLETKEKYRKLKMQPEFRLTCDEEGAHKILSANKTAIIKDHNKKSKHHLEEKLKNVNANLSHLKNNNDGFHKSLDLVTGLIKGLDAKIQKIRELKESSPRMTISEMLDSDKIDETL